MADGHHRVVQDSGSCAVRAGVVVHLAIGDPVHAAVCDTTGGEGRPFPAGAGGGRVAVDLAVLHSQLCRPWTALVPARDAAAVERGVAVDLAVVDGRGAEQVLDPAAARVGRHIAVHL